MSANIVGIDLSLTATGIAMVDGVDVFKPTTNGVVRLALIRDHVIEAVGYRSRLAVIEGYSYNSKDSHAHALGELGGVVRLALMEHGVDYHIVPPATLKKFACNKGNAGKPDMLDAARRCGYTDTNNDNAVDAWWLRQFGLYAFETPAAHMRCGYRAAVIDAWLANKEAA